MEWSSERDKIAPALVQAQAKIAGAEKRSKNPGLRNEYADLDSVWDTIRPALQTAGLAVIQAPTIAEQQAVVVTEILHTSGQWCRHACAIPVPQGNRGVNASQAAGVAVTYARRYALIALLGVAGEDTDGHVSRHDPSWKQDSKRFCAALRDKFQLSYDQLADHLEKSGQLRPSEMDRRGREQLWKRLPELQGQITGGTDV
jgi:hypothetical protein